MIKSSNDILSYTKTAKFTDCLLEFTLDDTVKLSSVHV